MNSIKISLYIQYFYLESVVEENDKKNNKILNECYIDIFKRVFSSIIQHIAYF